jgi:UDP-N-acetylglucosamine--N-acetylmuramyl-(pentapeptide) pyrophosphoryl-undecaprenol N-acetylglucosamine transferase
MLQYLHLTGSADGEKVKSAYAALNLKAVVLPFLKEMELAMSAATLAISRAGASSLAEIAALRLPAIVIPLPSAADNHQFFNATYFAEDGAVRMLDQAKTSPEKLGEVISAILADEPARARISAALGRWHSPDAAQRIADRIACAIGLAAETGLERSMVGADSGRGAARVTRDEAVGSGMISIVT